MILENDNIIGLKTGSRNLVYTTETGTIISPSCIAVETHLDGKPKEYIIGDTNHIKSVYPLNRGIITTEENKQLLIKILEHTKIPKFSKIVVAAPESELETGKNMLKDAIIKALSPDKELILYPECFCGAVSLIGVDNAVNDFFTAINVGSTSTAIGIFSATDKLYLSSVNEVCGCTVDERLLARLKNVYGSLVIDLLKVQQLKERFNMSIGLESYTPIDILIGKEQKTISCTPEFHYEIDLYAKRVADIFISLFSSPNSNNFRYNMVKSKVIVTGGMSNIIGLPKLIKSYIDDQTNSNIDLQVVEHGELAPSIGSYLLAKESF